MHVFHRMVKKHLYGKNIILPLFLKLYKAKEEIMESLGKLLESYLKYCHFHKELSAKTLKAYRIDLKQFYDFAIEREADNFASKTVLSEFITFLHCTYQPRTVRRKIASLKAFFHYLEYEEVLDVNPFHKIDVHFQEPKNLPKVIPLETIDSLISVMYREKRNCHTRFQEQAALRDIVMVELLFQTGARISELCMLKKEHVNMSQHIIKIHGKGNKERLMQLTNNEVIRIVDEYYALCRSEIESSGWFFFNRLHQRYREQSVRDMLHRYVQIASISMPVTPHMFRHSFATLLLEEDVDIRYIQQMLGHSSITTTQIYTNVSTKKQRVILSQKHPRNQLHMTGGNFQ